MSITLDMNGLMAPVEAIQARKGLAIPAMVETTYSDRLSAREDATDFLYKL